MGLHSDNVLDVACASNFKEVRTKHIHLDLKVSFESKTISGWTELTLVSLKDELKSVFLDAHETLTISEVNVKGEGHAEFSNQPFAKYGMRLVIILPKLKNKGDEFVIEIKSVASSGPGLSWLEAQQTADKVKPFMYTQGQSVLNRSIFPCQDTPAVKAPYSAFLAVPEGFTAVMSANKRSFGDKANRDGDKNCYFFEQTVPVQSYLVALAVGDLKSAKVGPRSHVWSEPSMLERARAEFDGVIEEFIQTGESLFGEYVWGIYDIVILPPSFPYGGMENPCLTFVTPCIIVGDKSLIDVVIHEITHSWFGNLVTNANWSEFWLNEGFTMFGQRRISEKIYGKPAMCLEAASGQSLLHRHVHHAGHDSPLTRLRVIIDEGVDPDDTYNETPYEKGFCFVSYLQHLVGDVDEFDKFLKSYVSNFKYQSIVAEDFFDFFLDYFPKLKEEKVHEKPGFEFVETWLKKTGLPPYNPDLSAHSVLSEPAGKLADLYLTGQKSSDVVVEYPNIEGWTTYQIIYFLDQLAAKSPLEPDQLKKLTNHCSFLSTTNNAELRLRWCEIIIKNDLTSHFADIRNFLHSQGKQKYTKPIYQQMMAGSQTVKELAKQIFQETKQILHQNVREYVEEIMRSGGCLD